MAGAEKGGGTGGHESSGLNEHQLSLQCSERAGTFGALAKRVQSPIKKRSSSPREMSSIKSWKRRTLTGEAILGRLELNGGSLKPKNNLALRESSP